MKIKNNKIDIIMEIICLVLLIGIVLYLCMNWSDIPDKIPMHYDWAGNIDRWGNKGEIVFLTFITWFLYLMITVLEQMPNIWNTGVKVTEANKESVYRVLKYMIKSLKLIMVIDLTYITINTLMGRNLPEWFTFAFLILVFGDLFFWIGKLVKLPK